jgi:hypothetical protein
MPYAYYDRLSPARQRTYRRSDAIASVELPDPAALVPLARAIEPALATGEPRAAQAACQALVDAMNRQLGTPPVRTRVLARRPSDAGGELHGLYEPDNGGQVARASVWMRTAARDEVVKFRTFLRTLVHEMCHHLDYELYRLPETFHTEGFYARESALVRALLGEPPKGDESGTRPLSPG